MQLKVVNRYCVVLGLAAVSCAIGAKDPASDVTEIVIEGQHDSNAIGTSDAASQGVVKGTTLQDQPLLRPGDVLKTVPGLVITQHSGDGKANQYFLRGYNLDHGTDFATSINGVPVNMPTNAHGQGYTDLNYLIPELVDQIEYRKGPYFSQNGDFSSAGSADIRYKNKLNTNLYGLTVGAFGYRRQLLAGSVGLGAPTKDGLIGNQPQLLGALEMMQNSGPWKNPESLKKTNAFMRLSGGTRARGWSVDFNNYTAKWNSTDQVPLDLINSGQLGRYDTIDPTDGGSTGRTILAAEKHDLDSTGYLKMSAFMQRYRLSLWSNFTYYETNPVNGDQFHQVEDRSMWGGTVAKGFNHALLGHDSITELGLQLRRDNVHVGLSNTQARTPLSTVSDNLVGQTQTGLYVQNTTTWMPWLRTLAGLHQDFIDMDMTSFSHAQNTGKGSGQKTSPKLSAIFGPWNKTEFFINYGQGFHSNDARGVINKINPSTGRPSSPVPALVGSIGKEIGIKTEIIPRLQSSVALWSLDSDSELVYSADSGSTSPKGASKRSGAEWNNHYVANQWLFLDADLAWTRARYATMNDNGATGNSIPNAVGRVATLRAAAHGLGPWSAGIETRYIGAYPLNQDSRLTAPSAIVTNVRLQNKINANLSFNFDVLNIFNRPYYDIAYAQDYQISPAAPTVPEGITVHPGEPRQLRVTMSLKF